MGFFKLDEHRVKAPSKGLKGYSLDLLHKQGCKACPLNDQRGLETPHMDPMGTREPVIYMLGESPSEADDHRGTHFAGKAGKLLRDQVPVSWLRDMRWNHIVRTHYLDQSDKKPIPEIAVEACRPSIIKDIEETKPFAIFGFGAGPLKWVADEVGIAKWAGRYMPVTIGKHTCWFFPMLDPVEVLKKRKFEPRQRGDHGSDEEFWFAIMIKKALDIVDGLPDPFVHTPEFALKNVEYVTGHKPGDLDKVLDFFDLCYEADDFGFDYETNRLRPYNKNAKILTVGLAVEGRAFAFPLDHPRAGWSKSDLKILEKEWVLFLHNAKGKRLVHNVPFEGEWTAFMWGRRAFIDGDWECTQSQGYILDERPWTNSLGFATKQWFGIDIKELHKVDRKNMEAVDLEVCLKYNGVDAKYHFNVYHRQRQELKVEGMQRVYDEHMLRVVASTLTHLKGVPIDSEKVEEFHGKLQKEIRAIEDEIFDLDCVRRWEKVHNKELGLGNNDELLSVFEDEGIKLEKTKDEELQKVKHPFAKLIRKWRGPSKLLSTYIVPVRKGSEHLFEDGYLHPIINCMKTRTWRTASEDPNIQNWPHRGHKVYIRELVKPIGGTEKVIVAVDYGGMQARNVAMESLDPTLRDMYWTGYDIHQDWLNALKKLVPNWMPVQELGEVKGGEKGMNKALRDIVKNKFVFPAFFGAHETSLARYLGVDVKIALNMREQFMDKFRGVEKWHENRRQFYKKHGYITGATGFIRRAPIEMNQLINAPIQADETFIVCRAWHTLSVMDDPLFTPSWMIHDDLTFIWEKREVEKRLETIVPVMVKWTADWQKACPLAIDVKLGPTWENLKPHSEWWTTSDNGYREVTKK